MAEATPFWKQAFDKFEETVGPELEQLVRTERFQDVYADWIKVQHRMRRDAERVTQRMWQFWGLAHTDEVKALSAQIAALEQEVRELRSQLEARNEPADARPVRPRRPRRTGS
jgi:hypothetical protein